MADQSHHADPILSTFPQTAKIVDLRSGQVLSVSDFQALTHAEAGEISNLGLPERGPVVIGHGSALNTLVTIFAAWQAGHPAVVVNPKLSQPERDNVVRHTSALAWFGAGSNTLFADSQTYKKNSPGRSSHLGRDEAALVLMTSGTTGVPKGIVHTMRSLETRLALNVAHIGRHVLARSLCVLPAYFGHGLIGNCLTPLVAGGTLFLWNSPQISEIPSLGNLIDDNNVTFMSSVPSFWKLAMRMGKPPKKPLQRLHVGSAPLSIEQWKEIARWNGTTQVFNMYGMSETANWISGGCLDEALHHSGYVGHVWGGALALLDDKGTLKNQGKGEVLLQSPSMMVEYLNAPELTRQAFHNGWFRTGDIGELMADGSLRLVGRIKTEINRAGIKIQAEEIDMLLERHPLIIEACAFGLSDPASGELVGAAIVLTKGAKTDEAAIKDWCGDKVRAEAMPSRLFIVDEIPKNDRGKINRLDVKRLVVFEPVDPAP